MFGLFYFSKDGIFQSLALWSRILLQETAKNCGIWKKCPEKETVLIFF